MNALIGYMIDGRNGGIDKYLLHVLSVTHEAGIHCDVLTNKANDSLTQALTPYKAEIFEVPTLWHPLRQFRAMKEILGRKQYDVAYFNISEPMNCVGILAARRSGIKRVVIHGHAVHSGDTTLIGGSVRSILNGIARPFLIGWGDSYYACSKAAGQWLFGNKVLDSSDFHIIYNPVDVAAFAYDPAVREQMRATLSLDGKYVIGHVGNFQPAKNSLFLLDILEALLPQVPEAVLLSVGDGPERETVMAAAKERGLAEHILFLGVRDDVPRLMQAMDYFVFPSLYEGLGIAAVEAQLAGLPVLLSEAVPGEVKFTASCEFLPLHKGGVPWAERIAAGRDYRRKNILHTDTDVGRFDLVKQRMKILAIFSDD